MVILLISVAACSKDKPVEPEPVIEEEIVQEETIIPEIIPLLTLENEQILAEFETDSEDTILEFDELTISIPADAYDSEVSFKIVTKDIVADQFELIEPVSSFYEIDNGNVFSEVPIGLQIPLDSNTDGFVMAFYFDEESEDIEGIPSIRLENDRLLVMTHHFSNVFVGMMNEEDLEKYKSGGAITTKFTPGIDDFSFVNYGSFIAPGGHCSGQSIAAMWYFKNIRRFKLDDPSSALYGLLDNNGLFPTPKVWQDDSLLYRFASSVHEDEKGNNMAFDEMYIANIFPDYEYDLIPDYNAKNHWDAFHASMILTHRPQLVGIYREEEGKKIVGHAMIAYMIEDNKLYVADPNYPGETRYIEYNNGEFKSYSSGTNAQEIKDSGEIGFNRVYFLGEFATIDELKVENRWKEVMNKDLENEYFPYPMIISDGTTSYKKSYEFNIDISQPDLQDKLEFQVIDKNLHKITPSLSNGYKFSDSLLSIPLVAVNDEKLKIIVPLKDEGDNWLGFYFVDKSDEWVGFQWIKIFVDTKLQLTTDKYIINPGDTAHIEASMSTGIDFPNLDWEVDQGLDWEIDGDGDSIMYSKSKTYDFTSDELGDHLIIASDPLSSLFAEISITVTDDTIEEHDPIPEEESHIAQGTYSCSFWLTSYEAVPFETFKADAFYSAEYKKQLATDNADNYNEMYAAKFGEITHDKDDFSVTVHDDGTCDISLSTFLYVNSNSDGISGAPFNGGNIHWTKEVGNAKFEGNVTLGLTDDGVEMKGSITKKNPEYQFMFNETKTYYFEGVKIH